MSGSGADLSFLKSSLGREVQSAGFRDFSLRCASFLRLSLTQSLIVEIDRLSSLIVQCDEISISDVVATIPKVPFNKLGN